MSYAVGAVDALDYDPCQYGRSKLVFRGPRKSTEKPYVALIGGSETYGRFVAHPFGDLIEDQLGVPVINFGCQNAGLDAFLYDSDVIGLAKGAALTIVQVMGAQNMSNRFYRVHPRRNDRFLGASDLLRALYQEVDFTDFSFTRHMLSTLLMQSADRFGAIREELRQAWVARMKLLIKTIDGQVVLLWLRERSAGGLGAEPLFVGADMVHALAPHVQGVVEAPLDRAGGDVDGMVFGQMERGVASQMLSVSAHHAVADALVPAVKDHL